MVDRTRALVIAATLAFVVLLTLALLWTYPFTVEERGAVLGNADRLSFATTYSIETEVAVTGENGYRLDGELLVDEAAIVHRTRQHFTGPGWETERIEAVERYFDTDDSWRSDRLATDDTETMDEWVEQWDDHQVVRRTTSGDEHVLVTAASTSDGNYDHVSDYYFASGVIPALSFPGYERRGRETFAGRSVEVYEPQNGWYELRHLSPPYGEYRVLDADGALYVDAETDAILYADLSYTLVDASNYVEYVYDRWHGEDVVEFDVQFEFRDGVDVERPTWAEEPD